MGHAVLVVDDEDLIRRSLQRTFEHLGFTVTLAAGGEEALALMEQDVFACAIVDIRLGKTNGLEVLRAIRARHVPTRVIMITAHGDVENAITALRLGAYDFIKKPFDLEEVITSVQNALREHDLEARVAYLDAQSESRTAIVGESPAIVRTVETLRRIARTPVPVVLVRGASGTGKELAARLLHKESDHGKGPFIELNCSALPEQLVESELFGHERGAFSDARDMKRGLVELAEGGTLFLDEVGDLPTSAQAKLLKFVESHEFRRVGGTRVLKVSCRIVAATHKHLEDTRDFRADLLYRLAGICVTLPNLRERGEDILLLARHFLKVYAEDYRRRQSRLTPDAERALLAHPWPGNVRELRAVIGAALLFSDTGIITASLLQLRPAEVARAALGESDEPYHDGEGRGDLSLEHTVDAHCRRVLDMCGGNKMLAAARLGITRHTLTRRLQAVDKNDPSVV